MQGAEDPARANPLVAAILAGSAPRPLKISAARGVLPLMKGELVRILIVLSRDGDAQVHAEAAARLASFPEADLLPMVEDPEAAPEILDHFGCQSTAAAALRVAVIANPATPAGTLRRMAPALGADLIDQLLLNLTRLIATPDLLDLLGANPALTPPQRSRIEEIRMHFLGAPAPAPRREIVRPETPAGPPRSIGTAPAAAPSRTPAAPAASQAPPAEESEKTEAEAALLIANATSKIQRMNTAEKIQVAMKGNREERAILIKDANRSVQEAVLDSPKLNENEVEGFARLRSVTEDVLRIIAGNREWVKNYAIVHALATNPKTPIGIAMNMVSRLTSRDLKLLASDKNVSEVIRRQARKTAEAREQRSGSRSH